MKLSDFILLGIEDKKQAVLHEGVLVGKRKLPLTMNFLFHLGDFYVETFCNASDRTVEEYRIFDSTKHLYHYIDDISLDDLLN